MKLFIETEDFKNMNVGFALDEGTCRLVDKCIVVLYEPPHGKTNNLLRRKQRRRSASR